MYDKHICLEIGLLTTLKGQRLSSGFMFCNKLIALFTQWYPSPLVSYLCL